jgi:hypothetical protein
MSTELPSRDALIELFDYEPLTGLLRWRERPGRPDWNAQHAGKPAGGVPDDEGYLRSEVLIEGRRWRLRLHRVAFKIATGLEPPLVDHENGVRSDNREANLREATVLTSRWNSSGRKGRDLPKGVYRQGHRYAAKATVNGERLNFGTFATVHEAHCAYMAGVAPLHGEFTRGVFA